MLTNFAIYGFFACWASQRFITRTVFAPVVLKLGEKHIQVNAFNPISHLLTGYKH